MPDDIRSHHGKKLTLCALTIAGAWLASGAHGAAASRTSKPVTFPVKLDVIERTITDVQKRASPDLTVGRADCDDVKRAPVGRTTIRCTIAVGGATVPYRATLTMSSAGAGSFAVRATRVPIDTRTLVGFVRDVLDPAAQSAAEIECGSPRVVVVDPGAVISCTARLDGERERFRFKVMDLSGAVEMQR